MTTLEQNLSAVRERVEQAAMRSGRSASEITLVVVTKTQPLEAIRAAHDLGVRHFGENRVEEAEDKIHHLPEDTVWHMIGHIQSRKAKRVVPLFQFVHSVDSVKLARRLERFCASTGQPLPVLMECNVSGEESKYGLVAHNWTQDGLQRQNLFSAIGEVAALPNLRLQGLMTMAPILPEPELARPVFARLRGLRKELAASFPSHDWRHLSMGMTDDFEVAIEEGATMIRVGRAIFDPAMPATCKI